MTEESRILEEIRGIARLARLDMPRTSYLVMVLWIERRTIVDDNQDRKEFITRMGTVGIETAT